MEQDKTYSVRWYGEFTSVEEVNEFEKKHPDKQFQVYLLQGYKKCAKTRVSYYCGQAKHGVYKRLTNQGHHINELSRITGIWIGTISNLSPEPADINVVEKILTAQMSSTLGPKSMLNLTNTKFPTYNAYVINIWHDKKGKRKQSYRTGTIPHDISDLIGHEYVKGEFLKYSKIFEASKIKRTKIEQIEEIK